MSALNQLAAVTAMGLKNIPNRLGASLVVVVGMACTVGVFISILSMSTGFMRAINTAGRVDRAVVLSQGSVFEGGSNIARDSTIIIADALGIRHSAEGRPIVSAEPVTYIPVTNKNNGLDSYVTLRGVGPEGFALRPEIKLISGRMFRPATHELIVGKSAQAQFEGFTQGALVPLPDGDWTVTGVFESNGDLHESGLFTDSETMLSTMPGKTFNSVTVLLSSPAALDVFKKAITANPMLAVDVDRETKFLADQSGYLNVLLTGIAYLVGGIMALGATFGALNTMYSAISDRTREIATLRAMGFNSSAVVASVLIEVLALAFLGAAIGAGIAWIAFNGKAHIAGGTVFALAVTPGLMSFGVAVACMLGLLGGLFPAIRAARLPVASALRAT